MSVRRGGSLCRKAFNLERIDLRFRNDYKIVKVDNMSPSPNPLKLRLVTPSDRTELFGF